MTDSHDCINLVLDGPGDTTVRPVSPEEMKRAMADRDRFLRLLGLTDPSQLAGTPPDLPPPIDLEF